MRVLLFVCADVVTYWRIPVICLGKCFCQCLLFAYTNALHACASAFTCFRPSSLAFWLSSAFRLNIRVLLAPPGSRV